MVPLLFIVWFQMSNAYPPTSKRFRLNMTPMIGLAGMLVMLAILLTVQPAQWKSEDYYSLLCAFLGAASAGFCTAGWFGHSRDATEWAAFFVGTVLATTIGSAIGGMIFGLPLTLTEAISGADVEAIFLPVLPLVAGFWSVALIWGLVFEFPSVLATWCLAMIACQLAAVLLRRETGELTSS